jgi:hypothetical protein
MGLKSWALSIFAVPVLYLLSTPFFYMEVMIRNPALPGSPVWLSCYCMPYEWLMLNTWLGRPLNRYWEWCVKIRTLE